MISLIFKIESDGVSAPAKLGMWPCRAGARRAVLWLELAAPKMPFVARVRRVLSRGCSPRSAQKTQDAISNGHATESHGTRVAVAPVVRGFEYVEWTPPNGVECTRVHGSETPMLGSAL